LKHVEKLSLDNQTRIELWQQIVEAIESYMSEVHRGGVAPEANPEEIRSLLGPIDFKKPLEPRDAVDFVVQGLWNNQVHTPHPRYFGLFNPAPTTMGIAADALVAAFNPQVATWNHSPFAVEVEHHLIRSFAHQFGYDLSEADGTFTSGGAEANHTAMLTALVHSFPEFAGGGLRGLNWQPTLYVSTQSHHSFMKAARICGLGDKAVRQVTVDDRLQMKVEDLADKIAQDRAEGFAPFMIAATAGTTGSGDPGETLVSC
jgi:glutamate/tyrosine decarboxylase-like PLP-dependent enzyme